MLPVLYIYSGAFSSHLEHYARIYTFMWWLLYTPVHPYKSHLIDEICTILNIMRSLTIPFICKVMVELYGSTVYCSTHTHTHTHLQYTTYKNHICMVTQNVTEYHLLLMFVCQNCLPVNITYMVHTKPDDANHGECATKLKTILNNTVNHVRRRMAGKQQ